MPVFTIEMFWGCLSCKGENLGRFKACQSCGAPRTPQSPEWMPGDVSPARAVTDAAQLRVFQAGADWRCRFCGSSQFRANGTCGQCGSAQTDAAQATTASSGPKPMQARPAGFAQQSGVPRAQAWRGPPQAWAMQRRPWLDTSSMPDDLLRKRRTPLIVAGVILTTLVLGAFLLFRTHIEEASVESVSWERTIAVERFAIWTREGWSVPTGTIDQTDLGERVHHYDHVRVGSHQESYTEQVSCGQDCHTVSGSCHTTSQTCRSNGNGSATCSGGDTVCSPDHESCSTKYCTEHRTRTVDDYEDQPRYQTWYQWKIWDWGHQRDAHVGGTNMKLRWPNDDETALGRKLAPKEQERLGARTEKFSVDLAWEDGKEHYQYEPTSADDFLRFKPGSTHKVKVGVAHGVEVLPD